jgi:hypothetical protein
MSKKERQKERINFFSQNLKKTTAERNEFLIQLFLANIQCDEKYLDIHNHILRMSGEMKVI